MAYQFNLNAPPLLKDFQNDILVLPAEQLTQLVGSASWTIPPTQLHQTQPMTSHGIDFRVTRKRAWRIVDIPTHYASDLHLQTQYVVGYSLTRRHSVEVTLAVDAGVRAFGFSDNVKNELKISDETIASWKNESTVTTTQDFKAAYTYCSWSLFDTLYVDRTDFFIPLIAGTRQPQLDQKSHDYVDCIVAHYSDKNRDPGMATFEAMLLVNAAPHLRFSELNP